jgi:hypothetical protein
VPNLHTIRQAAPRRAFPWPAVLSSAVTSYAVSGTGGVLVGGSASYVIPTIAVYTGAGGVRVGGSASATYPGTATMSWTATGGAVAGGVGRIIRSQARTAHQPGERRWSFRYELLDASNARVEDLVTVAAGQVSQNWFADIKRKARFTIREGAQEIDYLTQRIKPYARMHLPPYDDNDWVEWPLGVFLLSSPTRQADATGNVTRDVTGYDQLQVYVDDKVADRYTVSASATVVTEVTTLLGDVEMVVAASTATLPAAQEWPPGTPKLTIINNLLSAMNYQSLSFDEEGRAVITPYVPPSSRTEEYVYDETDTSLLIPGAAQELDLFDVANKWVLVVSNPDQTLMTSTYTNSNPASPTSTTRRGRTIVDYRLEQEATSQTALDGKAERLAFEASQVYESIKFSTGLNPLHSGNDVYRIRYRALALNSAFSEAEWTLDLQVGARMTHRARRVVSI